MFRLPPIVSVAFEVLSGKYGNSDERRKALEREGCDYIKVQSCVNDLVKVLDKYG
jgi:hypothetical protein